jgi:ribosomal protein S18 acetylase RimI-like enzyme
MDFAAFRPIRSSDAAGLHAIRLARAEADQVDPLSTLETIPSLEQIETRLGQVISDGKRANWIAGELDGQVVAYSQLENWYEADGTGVYLILGWVAPTWCGRGIGTEMLRYMESHVPALAMDAHPEERVEFAANASSTEAGSHSLLLDSGYQPAYTVLEMDLDPAMQIGPYPLPPEVEIRMVHHEHMLSLAENIGLCYRDEYPGGRYAEIFDPSAYAANLRQAKHDPTLWQVAWFGKQIIGQVLCVIEADRAKVFEVSVHPGWRRKGLARALLTRALIILRQRGTEIIRLHTVSEFRTRAVDLYQSVGFKVLKEFTRYRKKL